MLGTQAAVHDLCVEMERSDEQLAAGAVAGCVALRHGGKRTVAEASALEVELEARAVQRLGVAAERLHSLWNHPALSSLPTRTANEATGAYRCPPWLRPAVLDADGAAATAAGSRGVLAFLDLGNLGSACWVSTELQGELGQNGDFTVVGGGVQAANAVN